MWCGRLAQLFPGTKNLLTRCAGRPGPWRSPFRKMVPAAGRWHSNATGSPLYSWTMHDDHFEFRYADASARFDFIWLRDHCRSSTCYNPATSQRSLDTAAVELDIKPTHVRTDEDSIYFHWPDGHQTKYGLEWLFQSSYEAQKTQFSHPRVLWNNEIYNQAKVPAVPFKDFMESDEAKKALLQNFLLYGIAAVDSVPETQEATALVAQRVSFIRETIFGKMWTLTSDFSRADTAYTKMALDRHTDTTYFQDPCSLQVFHGLSHSGTGGRTLFVDGFYAAEQLRKNHPEHFHVLSTVPVKYQYIEHSRGSDIHLIAIGPELGTYAWNSELYMIRYNNYDRAVLNTVPHDVVHRWYVAHHALTAELRKPENELWVKLKPGLVMFVDNWRVLHGREAFKGFRQICGCYLSKDEVMSCARLLGLLS